MHLIGILEADLDEDLARLFGDEVDVIRAAYHRLTDPAAWPVLFVELGGGARLAVVYRNFVEDEGVDYLLLPGAGDNAMNIATVEGAVDGPGISWPELVAVADRQPTAIARARTLLLLAPMLGDVAAESRSATARLADALRTVGIAGQVVEIAEAIVATAPAEWRSTADGVNVCDDESSSRNPDGRAALPSAELRTVSDLLSARHSIER
ncbi:hypothetical protein ACFP2T_36415 [Plantactinospora solaniradicis]|uniref:Uncharacterized protein n=1 Tax=Plantactinospora solaniradicis TaxID=1723736 RepID=A0ABW1KL03_9ACTN